MIGQMEELYFHGWWHGNTGLRYVTRRKSNYYIIE
jgi:hypothetical protein